MEVFGVYQGIQGFIRFYKYSVITAEKITDKDRGELRYWSVLRKIGLEQQRKVLRDNEGRVEVLGDKSKAPIRKRKARNDLRVIGFISGIRKRYP